MHGIDVTDTERRKALLLATLLGESGAKVVGDAAELTTFRVGRVLLTRMPMGTVKKVNNQLTRKLVRSQAARVGGIAVGRLAPYGIGAAIGVAGGRSLGMTVIKGARSAFGPPPQAFPRVVEVAPMHAQVATAPHVTGQADAVVPVHPAADAAPSAPRRRGLRRRR